MANYAEQMKTIATQARAAQAAQNKAHYDAIIARMDLMIRAEAAKGLERLELPESDQDFDDWSSQVGKEYLQSLSIGITSTLINRVDGRYLELSWSKPITATSPAPT